MDKLAVRALRTLCSEHNLTPPVDTTPNSMQHRIVAKHTCSAPLKRDVRRTGCVFECAEAVVLRGPVDVLVQVQRGVTVVDRNTIIVPARAVHFFMVSRRYVRARTLLRGVFMCRASGWLHFCPADHNSVFETAETQYLRAQWNLGRQPMHIHVYSIQDEVQTERPTCSVSGIQIGTEFTIHESKHVTESGDVFVFRGREVMHDYARRAHAKRARVVEVALPAGLSKIERLIPHLKAFYEISLNIAQMIMQRPSNALALQQYCYVNLGERLFVQCYYFYGRFIDLVNSVLVHRCAEARPAPAQRRDLLSTVLEAPPQAQHLRVGVSIKLSKINFEIFSVAMLSWLVRGMTYLFEPDPVLCMFFDADTIGNALENECLLPYDGRVVNVLTYVFLSQPKQERYKAPDEILLDSGWPGEYILPEWVEPQANVISLLRKHEWVQYRG